MTKPYVNPAFQASFNKSLSIGEAGEALFATEMKKRWPEIQVQDVSEDDDYRRKEIDFILVKPDGATLTIEIKSDLNAWSKNLFIETWGNKSINRKGWLYTSEADVLVYIFLNGLDDKSPNMLWIDFSSLRQYVHLNPNLREKHAAVEESIRGYGTKETIGLLVPRKDLVYRAKYYVESLNLKNSHSAQGAWERRDAQG